MRRVSYLSWAEAWRGQVSRTSRVATAAVAMAGSRALGRAVMVAWLLQLDLHSGRGERGEQCR